MKLLLDTHVVLWAMNDRLLVAHALEDGYTIVTIDDAFTPYGVPLLRA